jgi:large subunit ribosomal protein L17
MRHRKRHNHLKRKVGHRKSMLANMGCSLIIHKRIKTTLAKAKELRRFIEPIITKSKNDTTHNRRISFSYLRQKEAIKELFSVVSDKVADRPGGYTRIIKLGNRLGDAAEMCFIELVDFNEIYNVDDNKKKRTRRSKKADRDESASNASIVEEAVVVDDSKVDDSKEDDSKEDDSKVDDSKEDDSKVDDSKEDNSKVEDSKEDNSKVDDSKEDNSKVDDSKEGEESK